MIRIPKTKMRVIEWPGLKLRIMPDRILVLASGAFVQGVVAAMGRDRAARLIRNYRNLIQKGAVS